MHVQGSTHVQGCFELQGTSAVCEGSCEGWVLRVGQCLGQQARQ